MKSDKSYGYFRLDLDKYLKEHKFTKYQLRKKAALQPTQLENYCRKEIQRIDLAVMARICHALQCDLSDIITYIPPKN
ncbi:MAG: helix-turn-helix transcriptional regulator [Bacillota bacterium]|nr:helix-turn-helix transcriptional regulator [Bacillota bacterium]